MENKKEPEKGKSPEELEAQIKQLSEELEKGKLENVENIKKMQKNLSAKDLELKKAQDDLKNFNDKRPEDQKTLDEMKKQIEKLSDQINISNVEKRREVLEKAYSDIVPEMLLGKTDAEVALIVEKQRGINKKLYSDSHAFIKPEFSSVDDIDKAIESVKNDKTMRGELSALKIMDLERQKVNYLKK